MFERTKRPFIATLAVAMTAGGAAQAQQVPLDPVTQKTPFDGSTAAAPAAVDSMDELVVTAQRRRERLQDVPIAVTVLSGHALEASGIRTSEQLTQVTPGLLFSQRSGFGQPVIRGIGTASVQVGDESAVAVYVDGVYISQMGAQIFNLANIANIEILKGPQGTLFGRNATGGAINITTRTPSFDPALEASASYGSYNERIFSAYASAGFRDKVAVDISAFYRARGNYLSDTVADKRRGSFDEYGARSKLLLKLTDSLTFTIIGDGTRSTNPQGLLQQVINRNSVAETLGFNTSASRFDLTEGPATAHKVEQEGISLQVDYHTDWFDLLSISAYRHNSLRLLTNNSGTPLDLGYFDQTIKTDDYSQEFRVVSNTTSAFKWVAGTYYLNDRADQNPLYSRKGAATPNLATILSSQGTEAFAVFVDGTLDLGSHFSITGGARYSDERRSLITIINGNFVQPSGIPQQKDFSAVTPRAVLSYKPTRDILAYASYSQGFKSGVFNPTASPEVPAIMPSTVTAYEVGLKSKVAGWVTVNASVFRYDYKDLQVSSQTNTSAVVTLTNAATARMTGGDIDASLYLGSALQLRFGAAYLDAKYRSFPGASVFIPKLPSVIPGAGNIGISRDESGKDIERTPRWTFNFNPQYTIDLKDERKLLLSGNAYYSDKFFWDAENRLQQNRRLGTCLDQRTVLYNGS